MEHYDLACNGFNKKNRTLKIFVEAIALQGDIYFRKLVKTGFVKLVAVTSSIKGFHVYRRSTNISEKLNCVLEETNRHSSTTIKVVGDANETIGHIPDDLSKVFGGGG